MQFSGCKRAFTVASTKCQDLLGEPKPAMQTHPVTECDVKCRSSEIARRLRCRRMKPQTAGHGSFFFSIVFFLHSRRNLFCLRHVFSVHGIPRAYVERASEQVQPRHAIHGQHYLPANLRVSSGEARTGLSSGSTATAGLTSRSTRLWRRSGPCSTGIPGEGSSLDMYLSFCARI